MPDTPYRYDCEPCMRLQALKSLRCWLYQCREGDVPESPLYKIFDAYAYQLAYAIVSESKDYAAAENNATIPLAFFNSVIMPVTCRGVWTVQNTASRSIQPPLR